MSAKVPSGVALTLWHSAGPRVALSAETLSLLARARPDAVMLHGGPSIFRADGERAPEALAVAQALRAAMPGMRLWFGVGCDGIAKRVRSGADTAVQAIERIAIVARLGASLGVEALVFDAEGAWKSASTSPFAQQARALVPELYAAARREAPAVALGMTSFDQPMLHGVFPWSAWCGDATCDFAMPQVYAAPDKGPAHPGALPRRFERHAASWALAVEKGWIRADLPRMPYLQAHGVEAAETITALVGANTCALWSTPARIDTAGAAALEAAMKLRRMGLDVAAFQREKGLVVDGICGPITRAALGVDTG